MLNYSRNPFHFRQPHYSFPTVKQPTGCPYHKNGKFSSFSSTLIISKCSDSLGFATKIMQVFCFTQWMSRVPPEQYYRINNICRRVQIIIFTFLNFLLPSVIVSLLGTNVFVSTCTRPSSPFHTNTDRFGFL